MGVFAQRIESMKSSEIRELLKITENKDMISFAGGLPAPELFPLEEIALVSAKVILEEGHKALQYSSTEGYTPLREKISGRMNKIFKTKVNSEEIIITSGSQQALDFIGKVFIDKGDVIFCESPTYLGALNAFRAYGPKFVEIPSDDDGMLPDELERILSHTQGKLLYVNPDFQNPTGKTWSIERRKQLAEIAKEHNLIIIEDSPYGELKFEGESNPAIKSMANDNVIYIGTFSKTFCPGMRIGWIVAKNELLEKVALVKQGADLHTSTISQMQINRFIEEYDFEQHIEGLKKVYKKRRDAMVCAMEREFPSCVSFNKPKGGLFNWVEMPEEFDSRVLLEKCIEMGVAFVPGGSFFPCARKENTMRVNFSNMPEERIWEGIEKMGRAMKGLYLI